MPKVFCLLNHKLTANQTTEVFDTFGVTHIVDSPEQISVLWSSIPTSRELSRAQLEPFITWLEEAHADDVVVLQGEHSATFALVDFALQKGLVPVCAVTERTTQEFHEGEKVIKKNIFEHICFRKYQYYKDLD
jgi:hypothetical protein